MATYYVDGAVGDDGNLGTSEGAGNAWATIDKAMNTVAAGDTVYVKASATYAELATIDTVGTGFSPIMFVGYSTTANRTDRGQVTMDGEGTRALCIGDSLFFVSAHYVFENFKFVNATYSGVGVSVNKIIFRNCEFSGCGSSGVDIQIGGTFESCLFSGNGLRGLDAGTVTQVFGCRFENNASDGIRATWGAVWGSVFYNNAGNGVRFLGSNGYGCSVVNCTIDGNGMTSVGVYFPQSYWGPYVAINNIVYDCVTGIDGGTFGVGNFVGRNNLLYNNTTNYGDPTYETLIGEVTSAPQFTDEAGADYTLASGSPALDAGFDAYEVSGATQRMDIGAHESTVSGGGGGSGGGASRALKDGSQLT